ncbi:MAG TPA: pitrilysin family protein [Candidatus Binatia bacterium]|nr:pitrilysin family protein [Candidatus Binatia bacterium]
MARASRLRRFRFRGLRIVLDPTPGPITAVALSVNAGARYDGRLPGLAHMAEHMLFQGTAKLDQLALNRRAAEVGGNHNASTGYESIALTIEIFNDDFDDALELIADQFYRSRVDPKRFRKERRIVEDEIRGYRDDPVDYVNERGWGAFFGEPIGHPICGTIGSLRAMEPSDVVAFLRRGFVNANAALAIVGGVSEAKVRRALARHVATDRVGRPLAGAGARRGKTGTLPVRGGPHGQAYVARYLEVDPAPASLLALAVALDLVGADPDSMLFQAIREQHGLGYDVAADLEWGSRWGTAILSASAHPGQARRLRRVIDGVVERAAREGFAPADIERARKKRRYRYASLAERRLDRALAHADSALSGFPWIDDAERIVSGLDPRAIHAAWRRAAAGRTLTAVLDGR